MTSYPIAGIPDELPRGGGGLGVFDSPDAVAINQARMAHLDSLGLPVEGASVLDVGCGVGHLARHFVEKNCRVTCVDGRPENIAELKLRLPGVTGHVARVETDSLIPFGRFQVVLCYGLLYHLENPVAGLRNIADVCEDLLLLETVISDHELPVARILDEPPETKNQALGGLGCRPTPAFVAMALTRAGFDYIYAPAAPPRHPDFEFTWRNNLDCDRDHHLLRCIFVASRRPLENPQLKPLLSVQAGRGRQAFAPVADRKPERIWLDVGAHLGEKTFRSAESNPTLRIYAFEPNLRVASQRMGLLPNFVMLPMAIAETDGSADFHLNEFDAASSLRSFVPEGLDRWAGKEEIQSTRTIRVPTMRLDTFLDQAGIGAVEFLKIDAQGADLEVVRSCGKRLRDIQRIELEVQITSVPLYENSATKAEVVGFLRNEGFQLESAEAQSMGQEENLRFVRLATAGEAGASGANPDASPSAATGPKYTLKALDPKAAPFSLTQHETCNTSKLLGTNPLTVVTPAERWSYALRMAVREKQRKALKPTARVVIRIEGRVESGRVGIGLVAADWREYIAPEVEHSASSSAVTFELEAAEASAGCGIIVRNTDVNGRPSIVTLHALDVLTAEQAR